jgi:hypothetical protein
MEILVAQISDKKSIETIIQSCRSQMMTLTLQPVAEENKDDFF